MIYAQISNNQIERINITLPTVLNGTTIPDGATGLEAFGLVPITGSEPSYDPALQRLSGPSYTLAGDTVIRAWTVEELSREEIRARDIPQSVTMRQARLALLAAGLLDTVQAALAVASQADQIEWEFAAEVKRDYPLILNLAAGLGLTELQLDELFTAASKL